MATNSSWFEEVRRRDAAKPYTLFAADRRLGTIWATGIEPNSEDPRM
jgi:hypothetical protein